MIRNVAIALLSLWIASCNLSRKSTQNYIIKLDGSKSYDPDGFLVWVRWQQISGPASVIQNSSKLVTIATAKEKGVRIYSLTGCDNMGEIRSDTTIKR